MKNSENLKYKCLNWIYSICTMDKIKDLLFDLEKKVESNLNELLRLKSNLTMSY